MPNDFLLTEQVKIILNLYIFFYFQNKILWKKEVYTCQYGKRGLKFSVLTLDNTFNIFH